jgi:hypothetical protein
MKVICLANSGDALSPRHFDVGYTASSVFHITVDKEYVVYGVAMWRTLLSYLIVTNGRPVWCPAELFKVTDPKIPEDWYFQFFSQNEEDWLNAVWGYQELIDPQHYDELANLEDNALAIFEARMKELGT